MVLTLNGVVKLRQRTLTLERGSLGTWELRVGVGRVLDWTLLFPLYRGHEGRRACQGVGGEASAAERPCTHLLSSTQTEREQLSLTLQDRSNKASESVGGDPNLLPSSL